MLRQFHEMFHVTLGLTRAAPTRRVETVSRNVSRPTRTHEDCTHTRRVAIVSRNVSRPIRTHEDCTHTRRVEAVDETVSRLIGTVYTSFIPSRFL